MATALFFKWTWIADEKLQLSFMIRPTKPEVYWCISRQTMSYILSYMSYILFSFPTPHIILDSKDLWASLVQKEWVLLQWALLWGIIDTRPVPGSRDSEEEGQVSVGVSLTIGRTSPHDSLTSVNSQSPSSSHQRYRDGSQWFWAEMGTLPSWLTINPLTFHLLNLSALLCDVSLPAASDLPTVPMALYPAQDHWLSSYLDSMGSWNALVLHLC